LSAYSTIEEPDNGTKKEESEDRKPS